MPDRVEETKAAIDKADIQSPDGAPPEETPRGRGGRAIRSIAPERDQGLEASAPGSRDAHIRRPPGDEVETDTAPDDPKLKDGQEALDLATSPGGTKRTRGRALGRGPTGRSPRGRGPSTPSKG
ncbi:hypothetical protein [Kribbella sp. NPDC055071]